MIGKEAILAKSKARAYRGSLRPWSALYNFYQLFSGQKPLDLSLDENSPYFVFGFVPAATTGIEPASYRSLWNSDLRDRVVPTLLPFRPQGQYCVADLTKDKVVAVSARKCRRFDLIFRRYDSSCRRSGCRHSLSASPSASASPIWSHRLSSS